MKRISVLVILAIVAVVMVAFGCNPSSGGSAGHAGGTGGETEGEGGDNNSGEETAEATFAIGGEIAGDVVDGVTVTLSGAASGTTTTDASGDYAFTDLAAGDYTITPSKDNVTAFNPSNRSISLSADTTAVFSSAAHQSPVIQSTPAKDGTIKRCTTSGEYTLDIDSGLVGKEGGTCDLGAGDDLDRGYLYFDLAGAGIGTTAVIVSAYLSFDQTITNNPYNNTLTIDHVNYGDTLETSDWVTTLSVLAGSVATNTVGTGGTISIATDLKDYVQADVGERRRTQFRLSFPDAIATDNYITVSTPKITVTYYQFAD